MRPARTGLLFAFLIASACGAQPAAPKDASDGAEGADGASAFAIIGTDGAGDATNAACPSGPCSELGRTCRSPGRICTCTLPCSGAEPEVPPPPQWTCQSRNPACPDSPPASGSACPRAGLGCGYGTCGGVSAHCGEDGRWQVDQIPPPP